MSFENLSWRERAGNRSEIRGLEELGVRKAGGGFLEGDEGQSDGAGLGVDQPAEGIGQAAQRRGEFPQAGVSDDKEIHIAFPILRPRPSREPRGE